MTRTPTSAVWITRRQGLTIAALATTQLMLVLDVTVVNVALPDIATDLGLGRAASTWVMTIYTTLFGGLVLAGGKAADLLGARRVLAAGLGLFVLASLGSALAPNGAALLVGRALQGVGAALVSPSALSVLLASVSGPARGRALAIWGSLSAVGTAIGVALGGLITAAFGWEWVFAVNVPIGITVIAAIPALTREVPGTRARSDLIGGGLVTVGTAALVYGLVDAGNTGWLSPSTLLPLLAGLVLWVGFATSQRYAREPMLRLSLLREPPVAAGAFLMIVSTGLMVGDFFLGSFTLQRAYADGALRVGLELLPSAVAVGFGAHLAGHLLDRLPTRHVAVAGLLLAALGEGLAALGDDRTALATGLAVASLGIGAVFVTSFRSALASAGPEDGGLRSAVVSTAHELGGAFGVALLSTLAASALAARHPALDGFSTAYGAAAAMALVAAVIAAVLVPAAHHRSAAGHHH